MLITCHSCGNREQCRKRATQNQVKSYCKGKELPTLFNKCRYYYPRFASKAAQKEDVTIL